MTGLTHYSNHRVRNIIFSTVIIACILYTVIFPPYKELPLTGSFSVTTHVYSWSSHQNDALNDYFVQSANVGKHNHVSNGLISDKAPRIVNARFYFPDVSSSKEKFPLILFSHGGLSTETANNSLFRELAGHGYVVCSIGHTSQALWTKNSEGKYEFIDSEYFKEIIAENSKKSPETSLTLFHKWLGLRLDDFNLILDGIRSEIENPIEPPFTLIDFQKIGVGGHSLGGSAALALCRSRSDIDAVLALESPYLSDIIMVENGKFVFQDPDQLTPTLHVYSDATWGKFENLPQYYQNQKVLEVRFDTITNVHLPGAGHFSLTDLGLVSPVLTKILEKKQASITAEKYLQQLNQVCVKFFDYHLKLIQKL